MVLLAGKI